jgi:hypothetical protein
MASTLKSFGRVAAIGIGFVGGLTAENYRQRLKVDAAKPLPNQVIVPSSGSSSSTIITEGPGGQQDNVDSSWKGYDGSTKKVSRVSEVTIINN